jgi:alanine racemase
MPRLSTPKAVQPNAVNDPPSQPRIGAHEASAPPGPASEGMRVLKPRRAAPADAVRPTRAEINLEALRHNARVVQRHAGDARVWAVLKADGYGHGAPAVARTLERAGVDGFCVALLEEGIELREAGIRTPILVMGGYYGGAHDEMLARGLVPVVYDLGQVQGFARLVRIGAVDGPIDVHLKIDTGMARLGVTMRELPKFAEALSEYPEVRVSGLMTHLACADSPTVEETRAQTLLFDEATAQLARRGVRATVRHAANSAALLRGEALFDAVRPGLALFGVAPQAGGVALSSELRAVMRVRSEIVSLREIDVGDSVGYGALFRASRPTRIATVPLGYADGLSRHVSNRGHLLLRGKRAPIVGAVSMDMAMIDVTDIPGACIRDEVVALGAQEGPLGKDAITADEVAGHAGTIAWEVLTSISRRVPRFYREP